LKILITYFLSAVLFLLSYSVVASESGKFSVAVASNFSITLKKLRLDFKKRTNIDFSISQASTGKLYAQIIYGAPYDMFFAADSVRPDLLTRSGLAHKAVVYAKGQLVLVKNKKSKESCFVSIKQALNSKTINRFAIANPKTAPYAAAAEEFIRASAKWRELMPKLVRGDNILQAFQFVTSGSAEAGLVAKSLLVNFSDSGSYCQWQVPEKFYQPIKQKMVVLKGAENNRTAKLFFDYIQSAAAKKIIKEDGYLVE
jgi:molybdate transport system substrate-binding protein